MTLNTILVAVDGSPGSATAVRWTAGLAADTGAQVVAVHARGLLESMASTAGDQEASRQEVRKRFEHVWCEPLDRAGVRCRHVVQDGDPVSVLLAVADEEDVDLIVVGSRGLGTYPEQLLGSTSTQVAQRATRPVTIVPSGEAP
jgi:nucleotide-binding universal stress UspA family protein